MRKLIVCALLALPLVAQQNKYPSFSATYSKTLAAAAGAMSIQQPSSPTKSIVLVGMELRSSVAATFTLEQCGAASGSTSSTPNLVPGDPGAATALLYRDSNASTCTTVWTYSVPAGLSVSVPFIDSFSGAGYVYLPLRGGSSKNYTIRSSSITGDIYVGVHFREQTQ